MQKFKKILLRVIRLDHPVTKDTYVIVLKLKVPTVPSTGIMALEKQLAAGLQLCPNKYFFNAIT